MITGDLDAELARSLGGMAAQGDVPVSAIRSASGTWRPDPVGEPETFATSLPFEVGHAAGLAPHELAAALAASLALVPWIDKAVPAGDGYLTLTVTAEKLAEVARRIVAAGPGCARSTALAHTSATVLPWPDLAAARTWRQAWAAQAAAMLGRLAEAAGACVTSSPASERASFPTQEPGSSRSPVAEEVEYHGLDVVRYQLARTSRSNSRRPPPGGDDPDGPYFLVRRAHAEAASVRRWADDLGLRPLGPANLAATLDTDEERRLLGVLSWLPERVASAARKRRPEEMLRYLEDVAAGWTACRLARPALPFGGTAAPRDPHVRAARLLLAEAAAAALAAGLALCGVAAGERI